MKYLVKSFDIVGYDFSEYTYCEGTCVLHAMGEPTPSHANCLTMEIVLDEVAARRGINRQDERSYDQREFPKVVFAGHLEGPTPCSGCGGYLTGGGDPEDGVVLHP
jgi:hypothetical protein